MGCQTCVCCGGLDFEILSTGKEIQARFTMDGTLSSRIPGGMGSECSITPGFTGFNDSLSGSKNFAPEAFGVLDWRNSPASSPTHTVLGASTVCRSMQGSASPTVSDARLQRSHHLFYPSGTLLYNTFNFQFQLITIKDQNFVRTYMDGTTNIYTVNNMHDIHA